MLQNLWDAAKAILRGRSRVIQVYLRKQTNQQTKPSNKQSILILKKGGKEQIKLNVSRRKELIKIRVEINEIEKK